MSEVRWEEVGKDAEREAKLRQSPTARSLVLSRISTPSLPERILHPRRPPNGDFTLLAELVTSAESGV